jgi:hypothetical protein
MQSSGQNATGPPAYLKGDADAIAQGVMEDYALINSTGKITTRADDLDEAKENDPKHEILENYDMKVRVHAAPRL